MSRHLFIAASLSMLAASIYACDACGVAPQVGAHADHGGWSAGVHEQFTHFGTVLDGGDEIDNDFNERLDSSITQLSVGYEHGGWGVQAVVPYIYRNYKSVEDSGTEKGIGDASLLGSVCVYHDEREEHHAHVALLAGVKFPTGDSDRLGEDHEHEPGEPESGVHNHDLALGSGSWDGIAGVTAFACKDRWVASALVQYAIRTEGDHHYSYANELTWRLSPGYQLWQDGEDSLGVQVSLSGEHKGKDEHDGEKADDTAMTSVYLGPACTLSLGRMSADIGVDVPVYQDTSAAQIVSDYRVHAAVIARF